MNEHITEGTPISIFQDSAACNSAADSVSSDAEEKDFSLDGFQVVRREFFAHLREPSITFNNYKVYVNMACLQKFPDSDSVHFLINRDAKTLVLMPCPEDEKDSFIWCNRRKSKRIPKQMSCRLFFAKIADMMDWDPDFKYKILGKKILANDKQILLFDLSDAETYVNIADKDKKPKSSRSPVYPLEWQNQFGLSYSEHCRSMQINILNGYAVYSLKDDIYKELDNDQNDVD